jgi:hypothetical protein
MASGALSRAKEAWVFKRIVKILPAVWLAAGMAWAAGAARAAESPFVGEWKLDPAKTRMPDEMKIESKGDARYAFDFGGGAETIVADGSDQPGGYGGTLLSVKAEAPDTWIIQRKKDGRLLLRATWTLSKDGRQLTDYFREFGSDGVEISTDYVYQRAGGGSGIVGDWRSIKETMNSPFPLQVKPFQGDGLGFTMVLEKKTRDVTFDGKDHPNEGPGGQGASSSAERMNPHTLLIIDKTNGKVTDTQTIGLSADLKTLTITTHVPGSDRPSVLVFERTSPAGQDGLRSDKVRVSMAPWVSRTFRLAS